MKRRKAIQMGVVGLCSLYALPVKDSHLKANVYLQEHLSQPIFDKDWVNPVVIGIGTWGSQIVRNISSLIFNNDGISIYSIDHNKGQNENQQHKKPICGLFDNCGSAILVFSSNEQWAIDTAVYISELTNILDVYLKTAIVGTTSLKPSSLDINPEYLSELRDSLDAVIFQSTNITELPVNVSSYHPVNQTIRMMLFERGLIGYGVDDVKEVFNVSQWNCATTSMSLSLRKGGNPASSVNACLKDLPEGKLRGVVAKWQDNLDTHIDDIDAIGTELNHVLNASTSIALASSVDHTKSDDCAHLLCICSVA